MLEGPTPGEEPLPSPAQLKRALPASAAMLALVTSARAEIRAIMAGRDDRLLVVVGPCSIHDVHAAREYALRLGELRARFADELMICMRSYFEKPRTSVGWKGLLNDPHLDGRCDMSAGLHTARALLCELAELGMPTANEALDPFAQRYLSELISWTAIGARTTESQTHRELASGLDMPVGFKNGTDGSFQVAIHAIRAAARGHTMLSTGEHGQPCVLRTHGNPDAHVVLRGGRSGPNHGRADVAHAASKLREAGLPTRLMVDCSHDNSLQDYRNQALVVDSIADQVAHGSDVIMSAMIESHLVAGKQAARAEGLVYGQSITDACVDFATTEHMLTTLAHAVRRRRYAALRTNVADTSDSMASAASSGVS